MKLKLKHWHALANNWYIGVNYLSGDGYIAEKTDKDDHFGDHFGVHIGDNHYLAKKHQSYFYIHDAHKNAKEQKLLLFGGLYTVIFDTSMSLSVPKVLIIFDCFKWY